MNKKKVIKMGSIIIASIVIVLLFMFRVTICNYIDTVKVKSAVGDRVAKPDYQIQFLNNVETHGNGYKYNSDLLLIFLNEKKIIYSNGANVQDKVSFTFGDSQYLKIKIKELDDNLIETIQRYIQDKYLLTPEKAFKQRTANNGDIKIQNIKYDSIYNIQGVEEYFIPKADNTELHQILEQVKK